MNNVFQSPKPHALAPVFDDMLEPAMPTHNRFVPQAATDTLALGTTDYGPSYYLNGQPLYDGSHLILERRWGWMDGLFTWTGDMLDRPKLVFFEEIPALMLEPNDALRWFTSGRTISDLL
jgi:hypothetical protein